MTTQHKIVKTTDPESLQPCKIVSRPAGNCPYYLVSLAASTIEAQNLQEDIIEDTGAFFSAYDLSEPEEEQI